MGGGDPSPRTTETKAAFKTTEFMAFMAAAAGLLIAGAVVEQNDAGGLGTRQVWLYLTILAVGYMISRGLAKSGSRDPYWDDDDTPSASSNSSNASETASRSRRKPRQPERTFLSGKRGTQPRKARARPVSALGGPRRATLGRGAIGR